jgi:NADH dehydrogenase
MHHRGENFLIMNEQNSKSKKIIIVGGGFAGISIAKNLRESIYDVLIIDRNNYHSFHPLLYQVATGGLEPSNIAYPIRRIFRGCKNVRFRMADVLNINSEEKSIETSIGFLPYDYLILATGSTNNFFNFEPIKENLLSLKSITEALDIRSCVMQNVEKMMTLEDENERIEKVNISVIGAGPAGIEVAGALMEMKKKVLPKDFPEFDFSKMDIYLFEAAPKVLSAMSKEASKASHQFLIDMGVKVHVNAKVKSIESNKIILEDGSTFLSETVIWTAGVKGALVPGLKPENIIAMNRIEVNEFNQVKGSNELFAIGDISAHISEEAPRGLPMLAQVALQQGKHLAQNLIRLSEDKEFLTFKYKDKGTMATIGRNKAVVDLPNFKIQGRIAWFIWMFIHLISIVGFRSKVITLIDWTHNYIKYDRPLAAIIRKYSRPDKNA